MTASTLYKTRLLTPGPTQAPEAVLLEMAQPIIHHRTKAFQAIFAEVSDRLKRVFRTSGPVLTISGSGTTAFEAAQISLAKPGSKVLTIAGGKFGERWQDIYDAYAPALDLTPLKIDVPWGQAVDPAQVEQTLRDHPEISIVAMVHSETSTATAADVKRVAEVVHNRGQDALLLVDGITSVGALPVEMDDWGLDVLVSGSQKAMMLPPGLGFVGLGERAQARLQAVDAGAYYNLDLRKWLKSYAKNDVPFTPPVSLIRGQRVALEMIESQGMATVWERTASLAAATRAAMTAMGLTLCSASPSDSVTGAYYPQLGTPIDDSGFRGAVRDKHGVHIAGGQDGRGAKWKGKIFRISHMGYVDAADTLAALMAVETQLIAAGADIQKGAALAAAAPLLA